MSLTRTEADAIRKYLHGKATVHHTAAEMGISTTKVYTLSAKLLRQIAPNNKALINYAIKKIRVAR